MPIARKGPPPEPGRVSNRLEGGKDRGPAAKMPAGIITSSSTCTSRSTRSLSNNWKESSAQTFRQFSDLARPSRFISIYSRVQHGKHSHGSDRRFADPDRFQRLGAAQTNKTL